MPIAFESRSSNVRFLCCMRFVAVISLWILMCISTTEGFLQKQYIGCFYDTNQTRAVAASISTDYALTIEKCIALCQTLDTTYAALKNGNICHCRHDYGVKLGLPSSSCYLHCSGNQSEICGGFIGQQIAYSLYTVCPIGTYGTACDKGCHCKRDIPCQRMTGDCPEGCHENWSGPACNISRLQEKYIGCFYDKSQATAVIASLSTDNVLTIEKCIAKCQALDTTYAALQNRNACHCRHDYGVQLGLPDSTCYLLCSGNKYEICGGFIGQQIAYSLYAVCPIGTYGAACDKICHCKRDIPCERVTGVCQGGCHGNWSGPACNITTVYHQYIGCYKDDARHGGSKRAMELRIYRDRSNTIKSCSQWCAEKSFSYAGLQYSWECFCGDKYDRDGTSTACTMSCSGDNKTICGGAFANSVYSVCPVGNYGKSCAGRCHCYNDERCIYRNGSCPLSRCKDGWTGTSCDIRDCNESNGDCYSNEVCTAINLTYSTLSVCRCPNGFQRTNISGNCTDIDECSMRVCDPDTMTCTNTIGSYNCSCRSGFQTHNATACTAGEQHCGAIISVFGSLSSVAFVVAMAFSFLFFYRRRNGFCQSNANESSKSQRTAKELTLQGDETGHDVSRPRKSNAEDSSRNKPSDKSESADYVNLNAKVHGKLRRSKQDEAALNAASDNNTYESLNAGVSDETRIYADLKL